MGILKDLVDSLENNKNNKNNKKNEEIIKEIEKKGALDSKKIAETLGQSKKESFVPKVDVPPVDLKDCYIDEFGQINRKPKDKANENDNKENDVR